MRILLFGLTFVVAWIQGILGGILLGGVMFA